MQDNLRTREKIAYTGGILGQNMIYNFMSMYIMFFFTDLLKIKPSIATIIVVVASLWDAINDPLMGMIADKTRTKWGKFRPYLIFGPIPLAITTILCYVKFDLSGPAVFIYAGIVYILWGMSYTICDIPIWAISAVVSKIQAEKNKMITLGKIGGTIGAAIVTVGSIVIINSFGGERLASAFTKTALLITIIAVIPIILTGVTLKERIFPDKNVISMKENSQTITKNKPLMMLMISLLIVNLINSIRQSAQMYFVVYVWGDSGQLTNVGISLIVGMVFGMAISPKLIEKIDKKKLFIMTCVLGSIFSAVPFFVGGGSILFSLIFLGISFGFTGMTTIISSSMLIDAVDYSEWKLGFRGEGLIFSTNTFLTKLSSTIAKGILGIGLILMNYTENQPVTETTTLGFSAMMYLIPAASFLLTIIPLYFYNITSEEKQEINKMLDNKY